MKKLLNTKLMTSLLALACGFTALPGRAAPAEQKLQEPATTTWQLNAGAQTMKSAGITSQSGCNYMPSSECVGENKTIFHAVPLSNGSIRLAISRFHETDGKGFNETISGGDKDPVITSHGFWQTAAKGIRLDLDRALNIGKNSSLSFGAYLGKVHGRAEIEAGATFEYPGATLVIPGFVIPATELSPAISVPDTPITIPAQLETIVESDSAEGSGPYGGLKQAFGMGFPLGNKTQIIIGQQANLGPDLVTTGLNAGILWSTHNVKQTRAPRGDVCNGNMASLTEASTTSSQRNLTLIANICAQKTHKNAFYDLAAEKADGLAHRINDDVNKINKTVQDEIGIDPGIKLITGQYILDQMGLPSPYKNVRTSLQFAAAAKIGRGTYTLGIQKPVGSYKNYPTTYSVSAQFRF